MGLDAATLSKDKTIDAIVRKSMRVLVSYLGWPLHLISSVGLLLFAELLSSLRKSALDRAMSSSRRKKRAPLRFLVRLNNLPQVRSRLVL